MLKNNEYFDGKVKSIGFQSETLPASVGVMAIGEYQFDTSQFETMTVISGALIVKLPNTDSWKTYHAGETFTVNANEVFDLKVEVATAYLCTYEDK
ncbi:pyrimidine/purine nucleoside phosphorylase [Pseudomonadales bacterium]|nr:pyrimidine/purine nucleoside phosphorylase [Pseudomonadales bacterium]